MPYYRLAVLGDPISHSRSPEIHAAMLDLAGLEGTYERIKADGGVLSRTVGELRNGGWQGLNITMPLKAAAAEAADRLSRWAERSRSVNTLSSVEDVVWGHSTDSATFSELIRDRRFPDINSILLLGAGGTARAAMASGLDGDRRVYVAARRSSAARDLTETFGGDVVTWGTSVAGALVINTTPVGMHGEILPRGVVEVAAGLIDLPYSSQPTPAARMAAEQGISLVDGYEFLIRQAMASFRVWTGVSVVYDELLARLDKDLKSS